MKIIQIFDINKKKICDLKEYKNIKIEYFLESGDESLSFYMRRNNEFYNNILEECYVQTGEQEYVIKNKKIINEEYALVECQLNLEDLEAIILSKFDNNRINIDETMNKVLLNTGWRFNVTNSKKLRRVLRIDSNVLDVIKNIFEVYNYKPIFNTLSKTISIRISEEKGLYNFDEINVKRIGDNSYDYATRMIPKGINNLDISKINNGKNFVENHVHSNKIKSIYWKNTNYSNPEDLKEDAETRLSQLAKPRETFIVKVRDLSQISKNNILDYRVGDKLTHKNLIKTEILTIIRLINYPDNIYNNLAIISNCTLNFPKPEEKLKEIANLVSNAILDDGTINGKVIDNIDVNQIQDFKNKVSDAAQVNKILSQIDEMNLNKVNVAELNATKAKINDLEVTGTATIRRLNVTDANVENLKTHDLTAINANIKNLKVEKADVVDLNVAVEKVGILEGKSASFENALAGNLTADNFHANSITAGSGIIAEGAIGDAQISSLSGNKLNFGTVDTSKVTIAGSTGRFRIVGNKLQVLDNKDGKLYERIMLGIDDNNKSTLALRGKDGQTTLIDENGLTDAGFTNGYGKVNENSLDASKFDKNSIVRQVNGSTETIKSTKVQIGDRTLDVELNTQNNTITDHGKELSTQKASIQALDNAIKLKVDNQTFTQSTNNINSNINNALNSAKEFTTAQIRTTNSNLSKATSEINILKDQISTKVGQTDIDKSISNIKFGGRNLGIDTGYKKDFEYWIPEVNGNMFTIIQDPNFGNVLKSNRLRFTGTVNTKDVKKNDDITISFWAKSDVDSTFEGAYLTDGSVKNPITNCKTFKLTPKWQYFSFTQKALFDGNNGQRLYFYSDGTKIMYLTHVKVEKGNKPTDYTEAPEDLNQAIIDSAKVVTDKINDVSTKLVQAKDSLQASVNSLNSTTQTITTNLTNTTNNLNNKIDNIQIGGRNLVRISNIVRYQTSGTFDPVTNTWNLTAANGAGGYWGSGLGINGNKTLIPYGQSYILSFEVKVPVACTFNADINCFPVTGSAWSGNDNDNVDKRKISNKNLEPNRWIKCWISYENTSSQNTSFKDIYDNTVFGIINNTGSNMNFQIRNVKGELGTKATDWTPAPEDVESNIDSAKQQAINSANSHADAIAISKANEALNNAKTYTNAQITTVNTRVSNAESSINILKGQISTKVSQSDIDRTVNNIKFGGRNLIPNSYINVDTSDYGAFGRVLTVNLQEGETYCLSIRGHINQQAKNDGKELRCYIYEDTWSYGSTSTAVNSVAVNSESYITFIPKKTGIYKFAAYMFPSGGSRVGKVTLEWAKLEKGTKPTDWTPAPEDIGQEIKDNITTVTEKINTAESSFTQKTNSINSKVSQIESTTNSLNGKITSNTNRISNAESKITPNAIVNSVNSNIASGGAIKGTSTILDKDKLTIKDSDNSRIELQKGGIFAYNTNNKKTYYLNDGEIGICAKDNSDPLGMMTSVYKKTLNDGVSLTTPGGSIKGVGIFAGDYAGYLTLGHDDIWGDDSKYDEYLTFNKKGWGHVYTTLDFHDNQVRGLTSINRWGKEDTLMNTICVSGNQVNTNSTDGNLWLNGAKGIDTYNAHQDNINVRIGRGWNNGQHGGLVCQDLWVHGNKHRIVDCGDLGFIGMEAYETSSPYFGDIGNAKLDESGVCYIIFDREFMEVCDTKANYKVDISIVSENLEAKAQVAKKFEDKVKIIGTPGAEFDFEIKAVQKGVEQKRFKRIPEKRSVKANYGINDEVLGMQSNKGIAKGESVMEDIELLRSSRYKELMKNKTTNKAYEILNYMEGAMKNG